MLSRDKKIIFATLAAVFIFLFGIFGADIFKPDVALSYDSDIAHPNIIELAAQVYNAKFDPDLTREQIDWMRQGAIDEDSPTRWLNHFYDPINDRGLLWATTRYQSSKKWAQDPFNQANFSMGDNSWQKAFLYIYKGNDRDAFITLGHTLHLIADASVPAHTRDDPHPPPSGDSYEQFVKNNWEKLVPDIKKLSKFIPVDSLDSAFDSVANFSNNNFYSDDTIESTAYSTVKINKLVSALTDKGNPITFQDGNIAGQEYIVFGVVGADWKSENLRLLKNDTILTSYSKNLLPKAVGTTAGVIKLFLDQADAQEVHAKVPIFSMNASGIWDSIVAGLINKGEEILKQFKGSAGAPVAADEPSTITAQPASQPVVASEPVEPVVVPTVVEAPAPKPVSAIVPVPVAPVVVAVPEPAVTPVIVPIVPSTPVVVAPAPIITTPVYYYSGGGGGGSSSHSSSPVIPSEAPADEESLSTTTTTTTTTTTDFGEENSTDDEVVTSTPTTTSTITYYTVVYTAGTGGTLTGSTTQSLAAGESTSEIVAIPDTGYNFINWSDGITSTNRSDEVVDSDLELSAIFTTTTFTVNYTAEANGSVTGTLSQEISYGSSGSEVVAIPYSGYHFTTWSDGVTSTSRTDLNIIDNLSVSASFEISPLVPVADIIINEIAWAGTSASYPNDHWFELYNTTDNAITIKWTGANRWYLRVNGVNIGFYKINSSVIPAHGYYLLESASSAADNDTLRNVTGDVLYYLTGNINQNGAKVELINPDGGIVDSVDASSGWFSGGGDEHHSMERLSEYVSSNDPGNWQDNQGPRFAANDRGGSGRVVYGSPKLSNIDSLIYLNLYQLESVRRLTASNSPYILGYYEIPAGKVLEIESGVVIKSYYTDSLITVNGSIRTVTDSPSNDAIVFTSGRDQTLSGDRLNQRVGVYSANSAVAAKDWRGFYFKGGSDAELDNIDVRYAGHNFYPNGYIYTLSISRAVWIQGGNVTITNSSFLNDGDLFIHAWQNSNLTVKNSSFSNGGTAFKSEDSVFDATDNVFDNILSGL